MKKNNFLLLHTLVLVCFLTSCNNAAKPTVEKSRGLSVQNIDSAVKPGDNFFMYANGKWYDTATILPTESRAGSRLEMDYVAKAHIKNILEEVAAAKNTAGTNEQKVGDLFASGMDTAAIEKLGYDPIKPLLQQINTIADTKSLLQFVAQQYTAGNAMLIGQGVGTDDKNSTKNIAIYFQAGLGLPDRDYYFKTYAANQTVVDAYKNYMLALFKLTGDDSATAAKKTSLVYDLEKQLAASHRTNVELRDPQKNYNKMAVVDLDKQMPFIGWKSLLEGLHVNTDSVNVAQPGYYTKLNDLLKTVPISTWKTYQIGRAHV